VEKTKAALTKVQEFLSAALVDGWCPYSFSTGQSASTEATAWAIIALVGNRRLSVRRALEFLIANQNTDGGWATGPGLGRSDWTSGPATLALRLALHYQPQLIAPRIMEQSLARAFNYLLTLRVEFLPPVGRLLLLFLKGPAGMHYARGWPWNPDCYNWVEPTSYCLMALKLPTLNNEELGLSAIFHANKYLLEHACRGGGWNHGCFASLGAFYPPYMTTTAEALLALTDIAAESRVQAALNYLNTAENPGFSAMSLAWSTLALNAYDHDCSKQLEALLRLQNNDGSFGLNYFVTALSLLAINTTNGINPLRPKRESASHKH